MTAASKHVGTPVGPRDDHQGAEDPDVDDPGAGLPEAGDPCPDPARADRPRVDHPRGEDYSAAGELLRALAAPLRIAIVVELDAAPRCVHELVDALDAPQPLISQHLRVLRSAGVVVGQRRGREVVYSLADTHVAHIVLDAVSHSREGR